MQQRTPKTGIHIPRHFESNCIYVLNTAGTDECRHTTQNYAYHEICSDKRDKKGFTTTVHAQIKRITQSHIYMAGLPFSLGQWVGGREKQFESCNCHKAMYVTSINPMHSNTFRFSIL